MKTCSLIQCAKVHMSFTKVVILCMSLLGLIKMGCSEGEPISAETALRLVPPVVESISCVEPTRKMCQDALTSDIPKACKLNTYYHPVPTGTISCTDGGQIECFIENDTAATESLIGGFTCESIRKHKFCKRGTTITNGTVKVRCEGPDVISVAFDRVISKRVDRPTFKVSFSKFFTRNTTNAQSSQIQNSQIDGYITVDAIKEYFSGATFVLNVSFSFTHVEKGVSTTVGATYKDFKIQWRRSDEGETYKMYGELTPTATDRKMKVSTDVPLFIPKNLHKPVKGVVVIKTGGNKIKVVFAENRENIYLNGNKIH